MLNLRLASDEEWAELSRREQAAARAALAVPADTSITPRLIAELKEIARAAGSSAWLAHDVPGTDPQSYDERSFAISRAGSEGKPLNGHEVVLLAHAAAAAEAMAVEIERLRAIVRKGC